MNDINSHTGDGCYEDIALELRTKRNEPLYIASVINHYVKKHFHARNILYPPRIWNLFQNYYFISENNFFFLNLQNL